MKKKFKNKWLALLIGTILLVCFFHFQNNSIVTTDYTIHSERLPDDFNDYKIVQLSDLHSKSFGHDQSVLVKKVKRVEPDLIVFTGDLIDSSHDNEKPSLMLMEHLIQIAPVYYVAGNHEWWSGNFNILEDKLENIGVQVLRNTADMVTSGTAKMNILGIDDPAYIEESYAEKTVMEENITSAIQAIEGDVHFQILLSHRPEFFLLYSQYEFDLVLSGHAHGGQFRVPFVGGLIAPGQGFFPKYSAGDYDLNETTMIVNRGLGNSVIPIRIFNRPEIVVVTLKSVK